MDPGQFIATASGMIAKYGMYAVLRRQGMADRACIVCPVQFSPMERMGQMRNPIDRKMLVSVDGVTLPPSQEADRLVTFVQPYDPDAPVEDEVLKIVEPPGKCIVAGQVTHYRLTVRR